MGINLDDDALWEFVTGAHTGTLTTLRRDGWPVPLPTWFVAVDGAIFVRTPARARKVERVRRDSRASFLVESGRAWTELRAVVLLGRAAVVDDPAVRATVAEALAEKYAPFQPPTRRMPQATRRHYSGGDAVIRFVPTEPAISWDNSRIRLQRGAEATATVPREGAKPDG